MTKSMTAVPPADKTDPWQAALKLLTRRDYSVAELQQRLLDKGFARSRVASVLARCLEQGYLNDVRYAGHRAVTLMRQGRAVGPRVLSDLKQRGIGDEIAEQALVAARELCNEEDILAELLNRRYPEFDYHTASPNEKRRVVHYLQRRGFALNRILDQLRQKGTATKDENRE